MTEVEDFNPRAITHSDPTRITIEWNDGSNTVYSARELRTLCPCARCVDELSGVRILDPETVADDLTQKNLVLVGNYAISLRFSDGHDTGIFTFPMLKEKDPGAA